MSVTMTTIEVKGQRYRRWLCLLNVFQVHVSAELTIGSLSPSILGGDSICTRSESSGYTVNRNTSAVSMTTPNSCVADCVCVTTSDTVRWAVRRFHGNRGLHHLQRGEKEWTLTAELLHMLIWVQPECPESAAGTFPVFTLPGCTLISKQINRGHVTWTHSANTAEDKRHWNTFSSHKNSFWVCLNTLLHHFITQQALRLKRRWRRDTQESWGAAAPPAGHNCTFMTTFTLGLRRLW